MTSRGREGAAVVVAVITLLTAAAGAQPVAAAAATGRTCTTAKATATAGQQVVLRLTCRRGGRALTRGRVGGATWTITSRPRHGFLERFDRRGGTVRYRPRAAYAGADVLRFRVRLRSDATYRGAVRLTVRARAVAGAGTAPGPAVPSSALPDPFAQQPAAPARDDGLPAVLPLATASVAAGSRNWQPTAGDTCPKAVHDRFAVIGPDGKRYPTWHPPTWTDPATDRTCTFGHEHGRDPEGSDLVTWVTEHFAAPGYETFSGLPFGQATEALDAWAPRQPGVVTRQEDHVGYKVDYANDVALTGTDGEALGVTCDELLRVHQGTHSADAFSNNVHELLYAVRCSDGTQLISNTIARFGDAGEYTRSCDPSVTVPTTDNGFPDGPGGRSIPDRRCALTSFLVPAGRTTSAWALYEKWSSTNELRTADPGAAPLARFDAHFGVFDPARYADTEHAAKLRRSLDLCWEIEPNGDRADGVACTEATGGGTLSSAYGFDDVRSPFNGTHRDVYTRGVDVGNAGGPTRWWTDPYGGNASAAPFPGAICQLIGAVDTSARPPVAERVIGRNRDNDAPGVHAPN